MRQMSLKIAAAHAQDPGSINISVSKAAIRLSDCPWPCMAFSFKSGMLLVNGSPGNVWWCFGKIPKQAAREKEMESCRLTLVCTGCSRVWGYFWRVCLMNACRCCGCGQWRIICIIIIRIIAVLCRRRVCLVDIALAWWHGALWFNSLWEFLSAKWPWSWIGEFSGK